MSRTLCRDTSAQSGAGQMQQAFLFDMDGLLLDTERLYQRAFCAATAAMGIAREGDVAFYNSLVGSSSSVTRAALEAYFPDDVALKAFESQWEVACAQHLKSGVPVKATVMDVLATLHDAGARMAVVTSTHTRHAHEHLEGARMLHMFETVTGGDAVTANKPDPAPYLQTAAALGVDARACFAFEDSDRGITAAVRAGCTAVQIPDLRPADTPLPDLGQHIASDLHAAMRHLGVL